MIPRVLTLLAKTVTALSICILGLWFVVKPFSTGSTSVLIGE